MARTAYLASIAIPAAAAVPTTHATIPPLSRCWPEVQV